MGDMLLGKKSAPFESKRLIDITDLAFGSFVYFLHQEAQVVYVGQSKQLGSRLISHRSDKVFDRVSAISVPADRLNAVESAFIRLLRPKYNRTHSAGSASAYSDDSEIVAEFGLIIQDSQALGLGGRPPECYGLVAVIEGEFAGQIGYYDDDEYETDCECNLDECNCEPRELAVVYLGSLDDGPRLFEMDELRPIVDPGSRLGADISDQFFGRRA